MSLVQKITKIKNIQISYWDNNNTSAHKTIILLPPGAADGDFFNKYSEYVSYFGKNYRVISPDYIGRGETNEIPEFDTPKIIAEYIYELILSLNLEDITLLWISFGTAVGNEIVKIDKKELVKNIILIAPGEFIDLKYKNFIEVLFTPALISERIAEIYRFLLSKFNAVLKGLPKTKVKSLDEQFISIMNYKIEYDKCCEIPCLIISLSKDKIIRKDSINKVEDFYKNHK